MQKDLDLFELTLLASAVLVPLVFAETRIGVFSIGIVEPLAALMLVGFLLRVWRQKIVPGFDKADAVFLAFVLCHWVSLARAVDLPKSLAEVMWVTESGLVFYTVRYGLKGEHNMLRLLRFVCYGAVFTSALGLVVYFSSLRAGSGPVIISSSLLNANSLSGYLIITLPILIAFVYGQPLAQKVFWLVLITVVSTALVTTSTRGGWLAVSLAILAMSGLLRDKRLAVIFFIYLAFYSLTFPQVLHRGATTLQAMTQTGQATTLSKTAASAGGPLNHKDIIPKTDDANGTDRIQLWKIGLLMWQDHPLAGVGAGNYIKLYDSYVQRSPQFDKTLSAREPHNSFIKFLAETGSVGLVLALVLMGLMARRWLLLLKHNRGTYIILLGAAFGSLAFVLQSNTNSLFHIPRVAFTTWLLAGLAGSLSAEKLLAKEPKNSLQVLHPYTVRPTGSGIET